jgi:hypothetical protein
MYFRLRTLIQVRIDGINDTEERGHNVSIMMSRGKISSSKLRKKIVGKNSGIYRQNDPRRMPSLRTLWGPRVDNMDRKCIELNLKVWKVSVLEPGLKDFCFKLLYGRLYLNLAGVITFHRK